MLHPTKVSPAIQHELIVIMLNLLAAVLSADLDFIIKV